MAIPAAAIGLLAASQAVAMIKDSVDAGIQGRPQFLRDGVPVSAVGAIAQALGRRACREYANNPDGVPGDTAANYESACRPYLDDIGYGSGPTITTPFSGGQCAVFYRLYATTRDPISGNINGGGEQLIATRQGPIGYGSLDPAPTGCLGGGRGEASRQFISPNGAFAPLTIHGAGCVLFNQFVSARVERVDGLPDDCGPNSPEIGQPQPPASPGPRVEPFNPSPDVDIDIDVTIGPTGGITFNIGTGPITIDPFGGDDGDGGDEGGGSPVSGLPPGDIGEPGTPGSTGPGGETAGEAPPNSVLVGLKVNVLEPLPRVNEYDPSVLRGVCYVYMGTPGNLALDPAGVALRSGQFFFAPLDNLTAWRVSANVGFVLQVIPYYRALELEEV